MTSDLELMVARFERLARATDSAEATKDARRLRARIAAVEPRVVLVGAVSRGKTRFLNTLVGSELPEGTVGVTDALREVRHDGCVFVDTPGLNNPVAERTAIAYDGLSVADVVIVVIAATSPVDTLEQELLANLADGRHPRRALVVVTMLDRIDAEERDAVVGTIRRRLDRAGTRSPLLAADDLAACRSAIATALRESEDAHASDLQRHLVADARALAANIARRIEAAELGDEQRQAALRAAEERAEQLRLTEAIAREGVIQRGRRLAGELDHRLDTAFSGVVAALATDLESADKPEEWWRERMPNALGAQLLAVKSAVEADLYAAVAADSRVLEAELEVPVHALVGAAPEGALAPQPRAVDDLAISARDMHSLVTVGHGLVLSLLRYLGHTSPVLYGTVAVGEQLARRTGETHVAAVQRSAMSAELSSVMRSAAREAADELRPRVERAYADLIERIEQRSAARLRDVRAALIEPGSAERWNRLLGDVNHLLQEIEA